MDLDILRGPGKNNISFKIRQMPRTRSNSAATNHTWIRKKIQSPQYKKEHKCKIFELLIAQLLLRNTFLDLNILYDTHKTLKTLSTAKSRIFSL
uniref:Putative ovule protein n=1 Tax=Solanum chacoense TaxID=4108 RepID=A0A0V0H789_SOLCH